MATSFPRSTNTYATSFTPVVTVKKEHSTEKKSYTSYAPTMVKSHAIKNCVKKTLFSLWTHAMACSIVFKRVAGRAWVSGNYDADDGGDAIPQCAKLVPFSYHGSWRIQLWQSQISGGL